ncbi:MAG: hypothetical protein ACREGI_04045 [Candidatus Levyibacteriota bacterium]
MKILSHTYFTKEKALKIGGALLLLVGLFEPFLFPFQANAAAATGYLQLDRMKANTATGASVCINPTTNETTVRQMSISFADGSGTGGAASFAVNATGSNWTWDTTNIPSGTTAFPGTATTSTVSTGTVTFIVTADQSLNTGTVYCLHFTGTSTLTTPTSAGTNFTGTIALKNNGGSTITNESVDYATAIISNDQISVTGTVSSTFSFSLSGNSAALSTISTSASTNASAITATISTNANNGWIAWVKSTNAALSSSSTSDSIASAAFTSGAGNIVDLSSTNGYVLDVNTGTNSPTIATEYDGNTTSKGGNLATSFKKIASQTAPASASTFDLVVRARASATNKAASDYADTLTVTAAGQF